MWCSVWLNGRKILGKPVGIGLYGGAATVCRLNAVKIDIVNCGVDDTDVKEGAVTNQEYPWLGVLFYSLDDRHGEVRAVTTVVLIHKEFVVANSADIGPMPKRAFRDQARVLLGEGWDKAGRRVRNYVVHPEYGETINSVAIVHLRQPVFDRKIKPICPPPHRIRKPMFWILNFENKLETLKKQVLRAVHVSGDACRDFYVRRSLNEARRQPSFVKCAVTMNLFMPCVWNAGAALTARDVWGRWQLLGLGVYGPGCGAPARFLDMLRYYPWIEDSLDKFQRVTISEISKHKYVLRSGVAFGTTMRFGECDSYERRNLIYRDSVDLKTDNNNVKLMKYNMTIFDSVQYTCVVFELSHASATAELRVRHFCPRSPGGPACYAYRGTRLDVSIEVLFTQTCILDIKMYGLHVNMSLLDIELWKWEEGTYYEDFRLVPTENRGPTHMTQYGFEGLDESMWVPDYDRWSTTPLDLATTTERYVQSYNDTYEQKNYGEFYSTTDIPTTTEKILWKFSKKTKRLTFSEWVVRVFKEMWESVKNALVG